MRVGGSTCGVCRKKREGGPEAEEARRDLLRFEASSVSGTWFFLTNGIPSANFYDMIIIVATGPFTLRSELESITIARNDDPLQSGNCYIEASSGFLFSNS